MQDLCPHCGWPDAEPYQVVSRRFTRDSTQLSWVRCACGSLQLRQQAHSGRFAVVTRGRPASTTLNLGNGHSGLPSL